MGVLVPARGRRFGSAPFSVRFDNDFADGFSASQYTLPPSTAVLPIECRGVSAYEFRIALGAITIVNPRQPATAISADERFVVGVTVSNAKSFEYGGRRYDYGALMTDLVSSGPAASPGLMRGDVVYHVNNTEMATSSASRDRTVVRET